ncbi:MAG: FG-GAP repeat protein, partial [Gemmatimonadota bacterium]
MEVRITTIGLFACLLGGAVACHSSGQALEAELARDTLRLVGLPILVGRAPSAVAAGDLTGDGLVDLVVTNTDDGTVTLLIGDGSGRFPRQETFAAGENPVDPAIGDLDGDGDLDVAIANHETDYVTLLANDGTGNLEAFADSPRRLGLELHPHAVLITDMDDDGSL